MKVFLSYPSEQLSNAYEVYNYLKSLDLDVWFDKKSIVAGADWSREIDHAQKSADLIVLLSSRESVKKEGVYQREINRIIELAHEKPLGSLILINIRLE